MNLKQIMGYQHMSHFNRNRFVFEDERMFCWTLTKKNPEHDYSVFSNIMKAYELGPVGEKQ